MRRGVDLQEAAALGSVFCFADNFRGGNDGVQQRGEIAERVGDATGKLSVGRDCYGPERRDFQREPYAERPVGFGTAAPGRVLVWDLHFLV